MDIRWGKDEVLVDQMKYLEGINIEGLEGKEVRVSKKDLVRAEGEEVDESLVGEMRRVVGLIGWGAKTQPKFSFLFSHIAQFTVCPTPRLLLTAKKILALMKTCSTPLVLKKVERPHLVVSADAAYKRKDFQSRVGAMYQIIEEGSKATEVGDINIVGWATKKLGIFVGSSTGGELWGALSASKKAFKYKHFLETIWGMKVKVTHLTDSMPLTQAMAKGFMQEEPGLNGAIGYTLQNLRQLGASVEWVSTERMRADQLTKFKRVW